MNKGKQQASSKDFNALKPDNVGVKEVPTRSLMPNPHNPRMLFDKDPLDTLKASIKNVGILVPLTVYWSKSKKCFVILDGQRRWICAQDIGLKTVPVNQIAEPNLVTNIVTMFQIHKNREDWELMPTALKLEVLMRELDEKDEKKLSSLTGLEPAVVVRCKKLLSYPKKFQDMMLDADPAKRVKADFFIELHTIVNDRLVKKMTWFSKDGFTEQMLEKYEKRSGLKAVTDFRIMKQYINNARRAGLEDEISVRLKEFSEEPAIELNHLNLDEADVSSSGKKLVSSLEKMEKTIEEIDVEVFYGMEDLWAILERLSITISKKLREADRRVKG